MNASQQVGGRVGRTANDLGFVSSDSLGVARQALAVARSAGAMAGKLVIASLQGHFTAASSTGEGHRLRASTPLQC